MSAIAAFFALLVLPAVALLRLAGTVDLRFSCGYSVLISATTVLLVRRDKRRAQNGEWRAPESTLHLFELLGGWPGAFLAHRLFRHKIAKARYQVAFWAIVLAHQFACLDCLSNWRLTTQILRALRSCLA